MTARVSYITDPRFAGHAPGSNHPERPARLDAVERGVLAAGLDGQLVRTLPRSATDDELHQVHHRELLEALTDIDAAGGGRIDADTVMSRGSGVAARLAAGAGLTAIEELDAGRAEAAFCAVRPPGHHATPTRAMGFCLHNNVAVTAASLAARGERVAILDIDAHHGNGTQEVFRDDDRVLFVSWHQWPLYPGTGAIDDIGGPDAPGSTINVPLPAGATGDVYQTSIDELVGPSVETFRPDWILISAGFDAHHADPLTDLGLTAGDVARLVHDIAGFAPAPGRTIAFLEGGYDLEAVTRCAQATVTGLSGTLVLPEPESSGGPGVATVRRAVQIHRG